MALADPFVLKCNGTWLRLRHPLVGGVPVLRSPDMVHWEHAGDALAAPPEHQRHWAPEVAYDNGRFFSTPRPAAPREGHQLRVAVATSPVGTFDQRHGALDPADPFTIDGHPFRDDDGQWYLF